MKQILQGAAYTALVWALFFAAVLIFGPANTLQLAQAQPEPPRLPLAPHELIPANMVVKVWIDPLTGCQYLVVASPKPYSVVLQPRLYSDGVQVCDSESNYEPEASHG